MTDRRQIPALPPVLWGLVARSRIALWGTHMSSTCVVDCSLMFESGYLTVWCLRDRIRNTGGSRYTAHGRIVSDSSR